ncbi:MAG TPA: hypothetical protein EYP10_04890, partial [Armatimonadetes bacterium]|nr:hypothetical protein [Armatimonadota bacterium]
MKVHSIHTSVLTSKRCSMCIASLIAFSLLMSFAGMGYALAPDDILTVDQLRVGMKGKGRSVFRGTEIEEFDVTIIGILNRVDFEQDIILVRIDSGTVVEKDTGIVAGMSGSPIFVHGKLIGAIAYGWSFLKVPIAGVQPIAQMLQSFDPKRAVPRHRRMAFFRPRGGVLKIANRQIKRVIVAPTLDDAESLVTPDTGVLVPVATPLMVSGL